MFVCPKPGPGIPKSYCMVFVEFSDLRWGVINSFVDIGGIVDHQWLNFLFKIISCRYILPLAVSTMLLSLPSQTSHIVGGVSKYPTKSKAHKRCYYRGNLKILDEIKRTWRGLKSLQIRPKYADYTKLRSGIKWLLLWFP
jgi:hypothetical protein